MAKIPGYIYVIIGLFIGLYSRFFGTTKLTLFWYVGLLFIFIGFIKIIIAYFSRPSPKSKKHSHTHHQKHPYHQTQGRNLKHPGHLQQPPHPLHNGTYYPSHNPHQAQHHMLHHPITHAKPVQTVRV